MPILPENKHLYPDNWQDIRERILERAMHRCERCGVPNHCDIKRYKGDPERYEVCLVDEVEDTQFHKPIYVVLTIAHLNHNPTDNRDENLQALCQLHHNRHDAPHRRKTRKRHQLKLWKE